MHPVESTLYYSAALIPGMIHSGLNKKNCPPPHIIASKIIYILKVFIICTLQPLEATNLMATNLWQPIYRKEVL